MTSEGTHQATGSGHGAHADEGAQAELHARGSVHAEASAPRVVTTGGKTESEESQDGLKPPLNVDTDTGEAVEILATARGISVKRRLTPAESTSGSVALIDALAFTLVPPEEQSVAWVLNEMRRYLPVDQIEQRRGCFGFQNSIRFGEGVGIAAWGGKSQRGRIYFSIQGKGCGLVEDWQGLAEWLQRHRATIKRVDVAYDDFAGESISIAWARRQYESDGFTACGRRPSHGVHGDWLKGEGSVKGRTLGIGNRENGKYCRIYEKGKQQGDPDSQWVRLEVEWRGQDRIIPYDILVRPGSYLAGAYPCLAGLDAEQSRIRTIAHAATADFDAAIENGKQQVGRLVNLMTQAFGGDLGEVFRRLRREGIPARMEAHSYQIAESPERLDPSNPGSFEQLKGL